MSKLGKLKTRFNLFSEDSAAVFITMLSEIGKIVKVSHNFVNVVPFIDNNKSVIGKNIKFMMSDELGAAHDMILHKCF